MMETRSAKRRKLLNYKSYQVSSEDRISKLPEEIVHHIFSFLPLECIARTCVLSKLWRHMWYSYTCLDFTTSSTFALVNEWVDIFPGCRVKRADRINKVLRLLEQHSAVKLLKFHASTSVSGLLRLMGVAVRHNVQELDLKFSTGGSFNLPRCLVNSLSLRDLRLDSRDPGIIRLPPLDAMSNGFKSLESLWLSRVNLRDQPSLVDLFTDSNFPSLTKLHLDSCIGLKYLRIQMPGLGNFSLENCFGMKDLDISGKKLNKLRVVSCFYTALASTRVKIDAPLLESIFWFNAVTDECVIIGECNSLKEADVDFYLHRKDLNDSEMCSVLNFLKGISHCHRLGLKCHFLETLLRCTRLALGSLQWPVFDRLESLELTTNRQNTRKLASLFRCSPLVPNITIRIASAFELQQLPLVSRELPEDMLDWESQAQCLDSFLCHLKVVSIVGVSESTKEVLHLVEFLLKHGKVLQCLSLSNNQGSPMSQGVKSRVMEFSRASSNAHIIFR